MTNMFKDSQYVIMSFLIIPPTFTVMFVELEENDGREKRVDAVNFASTN